MFNIWEGTVRSVLTNSGPAFFVCKTLGCVGLFLWSFHRKWLSDPHVGSTQTEQNYFSKVLQQNGASLCNYVFKSKEIKSRPGNQSLPKASAL